ncbi:MAG TPA: Vms1/Ankzf1 family peptidyl-tRNA hydrolase [Vicinamibacterales bacterium]|nr:Vms1/Ankzf1 family peptidyl-tRNA hydrolase [Vicinamibacterales bacterium]
MAQQLDQLTAQLDRLAAFDAGPFPVVSLYLNLQADDRGRDRFDVFLRKELPERTRGYGAEGPERDSLNRDAEKIAAYVADLPGSLNGLAVFACSGADLFEAIPMAAPVDDHQLIVSDAPHLYPLARLLDQYPPYAVVLADTHQARIVVLALNSVMRADEVQGVKTRRHKMGGWSQARYQRHIENYHLQHAKEVAEHVARIVRDERIDKVMLSGDETIVPLLREQMPKEVLDRIVDVVRLDVNAPERAILDATIAALREKDAETDRERVDALIAGYRGSGLGCVGVDAVRRAFELGQVDELLVTANEAELGDAADELVAQARNTSAKVRFIEDASLLSPFGGVGAILRFKL